MRENISFGTEQSSDDLLLLKLAEEFGTPLYVYDEDLILKRYDELHQFIKWPKLKIFYSMKANYNVAVLRLLNSRGAYLDTVSPSELHLALRIGYPKQKLCRIWNQIYTAYWRKQTFENRKGSPGTV